MTINQQRRQAADLCFETAKIGEVEDADGWEYATNSDIWTRRIYRANEQGDNTIAGSFGVEFKPQSTEIVETWSN